MAKKKHPGRPKGSKNRRGKTPKVKLSSTSFQNQISSLQSKRKELLSQLKSIDKIVRELKKLG